MIKWLKKKLIAWCGGGYHVEIPPMRIIQTTRPLEKIGWAISYDAPFTQLPDAIDAQAAKKLAELIIKHKLMDVRIMHENENTIVNYYTMYVARRENNVTD